MTKRFIATVLAASIAFTSFSAAPVRAADSGEIGRFLLGAGTLFIIGSAISNSNRNRHSDHHVTRRHDHDHYQPRPRRKLVPSACLRHNRWNNGPRRVVGQRCLNNHMRHANRLPGHCKRNIWTNRGKWRVYSAHCLRSKGWSFS